MRQVVFGERARDKFHLFVFLSNSVFFARDLFFISFSFFSQFLMLPSVQPVPIHWCAFHVCLMQTCKLWLLKISFTIHARVLQRNINVSCIAPECLKVCLIRIAPHIAPVTAFRFGASLITFVYIALHFMSILSNIAHFEQPIDVDPTRDEKKEIKLVRVRLSYKEIVESYRELNKKNQFQSKIFI